MKNKKGYSKEECLRRMKLAFEEKGLDFNSYMKHLEEKKHPAYRDSYIPNHEDNVQFGCCCHDTLDNGFQF